VEDEFAEPLVAHDHRFAELARKTLQLRIMRTIRRDFDQQALRAPGARQIMIDDPMLDETDLRLQQIIMTHALEGGIERRSRHWLAQRKLAFAHFPAGRAPISETDQQLPFGGVFMRRAGATEGRAWHFRKT